MVVSKIDKNRILVMDSDLDGIDMDKWKLIMKIVLGRHYDNLQKIGPGWSFPLHTRETFESHVERLLIPPPPPIPSENKMDSSTSITSVDEEISTPTQDASTSTSITSTEISTQTQTLSSSVLSSSYKSISYKHDIDPDLARFRQHWLHQLLI